VEVLADEFYWGFVVPRGQPCAEQQPPLSSGWVIDDTRDRGGQLHEQATQRFRCGELPGAAPNEACAPPEQSFNDLFGVCDACGLPYRRNEPSMLRGKRPEVGQQAAG